MIKAVLPILATLSLCACQGQPSAEPQTGGDATRGARAIAERGCGACHRIPGIRGARGSVAQALDGFAERTFIAGELPNTPENLVRWVMDPKSLRPNTAMPSLGIDSQEARDVAAYLYTLD